MADDGDEQTIVVKSNTVIQKTVTKCLGILAPKSGNTSSTMPNAITIVADANAAGKAISITEIVKRRIKEHNGTITQSTRVIEKPVVVDVPTEEIAPKHLQGEGYQKPKKRPNAQIEIRLETNGNANVS